MTQPYVGEIRLFPWDWSVRGWALCQGQFLPIAQNQALFALIGTTYGGNGVTTFQLPDLRSRGAVGIGQLAGGSFYTWGEQTGTETVTLTVNQIPQHTHQLVGSTNDAGKAPVQNSMFAHDNVADVDYLAPYNASAQQPIAPATIANAGGTQAHSNIQPYTALNYSIALQGLFPSRN
ncbi:phage tail protein [Sphingomonas sp.]|jgi:microcystin-dependent protein|uniref:phage tail protein n=1 Tax=Sphingomonas sp. TaxID=28214 RepID=UPI002E34B0E9|nr:tail fiber protein [Sphingomonas sp.]HEX4695939.1 tail fiber protein [Sphingomonas sp.]